MDAGPPLRCCRFAAAGFLVALLATASDAADFRTRNFIIQAPDARLAKAVGEAAEKYRRDLAEHWLGSELPPWPAPCPVRVVAGPNRAAQGVTTYSRNPVGDFQMEVVGTPQRILDSVLPHEVSHTVLATHFGRPLPRWADEGICTTVEHKSERRKHEAKLREFLRSRRGIAMNKLFLLTEYPSDVLPMYAQGYSVCRFLIQQEGPREFIQFIEDYMKHPSWTDNVQEHYDYESLAELQEYWLAWVAAGSGTVDQFVKNSSETSPGGQPGEGSPATLALNEPQAGTGAGPRRGGGNATQNSPDATGGAAAPAATDLASTQGSGWYLRRRLEAKRGQDSAPAARGDSSSNRQPRRATAIAAAQGRLNRSGRTQRSSTIPPSIRNSGPYSVAQPQPEQQISRGGEPIGDRRRAGGPGRRWR